MPAFDKARNLYFRNFGTGPAQVRFYLGHDPREARQREARLEQVWQIVRGQGGTWPDAELAIAKAIARGDGAATLPAPPDDSQDLFKWWDGYRVRFGNIIPILPHDGPPLTQAMDAEQAKLDRLTKLADEHHQAMVERLSKVSYSASVHVGTLLNQYADDLKNDEANGGDNSGWIATQQRQLETLTRMFGDERLKSADDLKAIAKKLSNPATKGKRGPLARETRKQLWQRLVKALSVAEDRGQDLPRGWAKVTIDLGKKRNIDELAQFTVEELSTLYRVASPIVRAMILLGLNCGFQEADFGDLEDGHLFIDRLLPAVIASKAGAKHADKWIMMPRGKTGCPGLHKLWPETVSAIRWLIARRDKTVKATVRATAKLFIAETGRSLTEKTGAGNRSRRVHNLWRNCLRSAAKHLGDMQTLPVKFLRKASGNYIREIATDDVVAIHLRHGHASSDSLMEQYARRPWRKVAEATDQLRGEIAEVFSELVAVA